MGKALVIKDASFQTNALGRVTFLDPVPCTGLTLSANTATFEYFGDTVTIVATPVPANTTDQVVWTSSDDNVVSVVDGIITLNGLGQATVTAVCGTISATVSVSQLSAKATNYYVCKSSLTYKRSESIPTMLIGGSDAFDMVGKTYNASDELIHVEGGYERNVEGILVPYGANYVALVTSNATTPVFKCSFGDPINRTEHLGTYWPTFLGDSEAYIAKQSVTSGNVVMLRLQKSINASDLVSGVLFSVS